MGGRTPMTDLLPEVVQLFEALARRIAANDRGVERADRNAGEPVGLDAGLVQPF